jgi:hypothetical protein
MRRLWGLAALLAVAGCGSRSDAPAGTGAREAALGYFEALVRQDWPAAYAALTGDSKNRVKPERFAQLAREYHRNLGFEPKAVHVTACDERGDEATAHVTLSGHGRHRGRFRDAAALRREAGGWAVVLSPNFGRPARR